MFGSLCVLVNLRANGYSELVLVVLRRYRPVGQLLPAHYNGCAAIRLRAARIKLWLCRALECA